MCLCVHVCARVCVCVYTFPAFRAALWTVHSVLKASCFSSKWKYADLHLFFLPVLFRWPHHHSWGEKNYFKTQTSKTHVKVRLDTAHLNSFHFSFCSIGEHFETKRVDNRCRCRWGFVIGTVFPARWTAVCWCCIRWVISSCVYFVKLFWHPGILCVWSFWCCHCTQRANY